jgi:hypothetical protein
MLETVGKVETLSDTEIINLSEGLRDEFSYAKY